MARQRINIRFMAWGAGTIVAAVAAVFIARATLFKDNYQHYENVADNLFRQQSYQLALDQYRKALSLQQKDADLYVKAGVAAHEAARDNPQYNGWDRKYWSQALEVDPRCVPAMEKLLDGRIEEVEYFPSAQTFNNLRAIAEQLYAVQPDHAKADAYRHIAVLAGWIYGVQTPSDQIKQDMDALAAILRTDASNPDVAYYLASAYVNLGQEKDHSSADQETHAEALALYAKADKVFEDAVAAQPNNAMLYFRWATVIGNIDHWLTPEERLKNKPQTVAQYRRLLTQARKLVTPTDPNFADIYIDYADFEMLQGDSGAAEQILRDLYRQAPDDQKVRLRLARFLEHKPESRAEAIRILSLPITSGAVVAGPGAELIRQQLQEQTLLELGNLLIESYVAEPDLAKKQELYHELQDDYEKLASTWGNEPYVLQLHGKMQLLDNTIDGAIQAIKTFEYCRTMLDQKSPGLKERDVELTYLLARAYAVAHQTGRAKMLFSQVIEGQPSLVDPRKMLTELYLDDHQLDKAKAQLDELEKLAPNDPQVIKLEAIYYGQQPAQRGIDVGKVGPEVATKVLAQLAETTRTDRLSKAALAMAFGSDEEAQRLLEELRAQTPADEQVVQLLIQSYTHRNERAKALAVARDAAAKDPDNGNFQIWKTELEGATPEQVEKITYDGIMKIKDPVDREIKLFQFSLAHHRQIEAMAHLDAAEKAGPDVPRVLDYRFQWAVGTKQWDKAEEYARRLGELDADQAKGRLYRFQMAMARGQIDLAAQIAQEMTDELPEFARSFLMLGQARQAQQQYDQAITNYKIALDKQTENIDAIKGIIECYEALQKYDDALRYIKSGQRELPGSAYFAEQETLWQLHWGNPADALPRRLAQRDANPGSLTAWIDLGTAYYRVAEVALQDKNLDVAQDNLDKANKTFGQAVLKWPDAVAPYYYVSQVAQLADDYEHGEKALRILADRPALKDSVDPSLLLAAYEQHFGKFDLAEAALKEALAKSQKSPEVQLQLAAFYNQRGRYDDALAVLDASSKDSRIQVQMIETLAQAGRFAAAETAVLAQLKANPHDADMRAILGLIYINTGRLDKATAVFDQALADDPKDARALFYGAQAYMSQTPADPDKAVEMLLEARKQSPGVIEIRLSLVRAYRQKHDIESAMHELENIVQMFPKHKGARMQLVDVYSQMQPPRWIDAEKVIEEAESIPEWRSDPDWPRAQALLMMKSGQPEKAIDYIKQAMALMPEGNPLLTQEYLSALKEAKQYDRLKAECDRLAADPKSAKSPWVYLTRAEANLSLNANDAALKDFDTAFNLATQAKDQDSVVAIVSTIAEKLGTDSALRHIQKYIDDGDNHWRIIAAYLYLKDNQAPKSIAMIEKVLADRSLDPHQLETALMVAGDAYMFAQEWKEARAVYLQLLQRVPDDINALNNLALVMAEREDPPNYNDAIRYGAEALRVLQQRSMTDASVLDTYGWVLVLAGRVDEGISYLQQSIEQRPLLDAYYHLGYAYLQKGFAAQAKTSLDQAMQMLKDRADRHDPIKVDMEQKIIDAQAKAEALISKGAGAQASP